MDRFWARVKKTRGCWLWDGPPGSHGYGQAFFAGRVTVAHRVAYELSVGPVSAGLEVCHRCGNRLCVRPDHLYAGTHAENMNDLAMAGTHTRRKLTTREAARVKARILRGESLRQIARSVGLDLKSVQNIRDGRTYRYA